MTTFKCIKCNSDFKLRTNKYLMALVTPRYCFSCVEIEQKLEKKTKKLEELNNRIAISSIGNYSIERAKQTINTFSWQNKALKFIKEFKSIKKQKLPYLWGGVGTGKTHLAIILAYRIMKNLETQVLFSTASELIKMAIEDKTLFNKFKLAYHPIIIDDLGNHTINQWSIEKIYEIINHRLQNNLPTSFTSNFNPIKLEGRLLEFSKGTIDNVLSQAITDRLLELCTPLKVDGDSVRKIMFKDTNKKN